MVSSVEAGRVLGEVLGEVFEGPSESRVIYQSVERDMHRVEVVGVANGKNLQGLGIREHGGLEGGGRGAEKQVAIQRRGFGRIIDEEEVELERHNVQGKCWTCQKRKAECDGTLPRCKTCAMGGFRCRGYGIRVRWPRRMAKDGRRRVREVQFPGGMSTLALPSEESFFMQHFMQNVARVALAIDYTGNGYRALLPIAMREPSLLNAAVAVAAAHYSRWHGTADTVSRRYLQTASKALFARLSDPVQVMSPITLASMLLHVSYEVFSGSPRWKGHYDAIRGWIASRGDCSDLDPFLKTWVCLLDTQSSLNLGQPAMLELESWMDPSAQASDSIDALFGCSSKLPKLMWTASRLYASSKAGLVSRQELCQQAADLQSQIRATSMVPTAQPGVSITCDKASTALTATLGITDGELERRMVAAAEIFRHASHIYVHRIVYGPEYPLPPDLYASLEAGKQCLVEIPDALGPGANLGWCLVVLGAEMESPEDREYITSRWEALHRLGMYNTKNGQKIVEEVWKHADMVKQGWATAVRWQDIMQVIGESQILV